MEIHFSHVLGIVWISASPKIFEKPITLECLYYPILFPYYENPLSQCFGKCMDFCFSQNIWETNKFEMFVFSYIFPVLWKPTFPMLWELYIQETHKFEIFLFSRTLGIDFPHVLGIVWISASRKICKKPLTFEYSVFPYFSRTIGIHFPHVLGTMLLTWKLIKNFYFRSHFHSNFYLKLFNKEVNLFCCWARSNICISDTFAIEVWEYIQYRRAGSFFSTVIQFLHYSYEYGNWNSFKNIYKWTSAEMFHRRSSAAFRTASIKNTHRWFLPKCSFAEYSQSI